MAKKKSPVGNKYAHLTQPQATLDFHGLGVLKPDEICEKAEDFVRSCAQKGLKKILVITGKGLHSKSGPIVGPLLESFLPELDQVKSVLKARRDRGGEGALEVELW
ncbi:MAG: Smr/MutS family protein [Candidatus Altimarinota bacterium]